MELLNEMAPEVIGYTAGELQSGKICSIEPLILDEDRPSVVAEVGHALVENRPFTVEYRLKHKSGAIRWMAEYGKPVFGPDGMPIYIDGVIFDITVHKQAEIALKLFRALIDNSSDAIEVVDPLTLRFTDINETECRTLGYSREELLTMKVSDIDPTYTPDIGKDVLTQMGRSEGALFEGEHRRKDGSTFPVEISSKMINIDKPYIVTIVRDITERKAVERRIAYLNRVQAVLSGINTLIVHVKDRDELFKGACRVAVELGGFHMTMISILDRSTMRITPIATAGKDEGFLTNIKNLLASNEDVSNTMVARAISGKKAIVSNDSQNDPQVAFGKQYAEAGVFSMVILPLIVSGEAVGALSLYANEKDFFHEEELNLLSELAGDIAFAIDHIDKQERLNYLAYYDALTGLANGSLFLERAAQYTRRAAAAGQQLAIALIDLERFKNINDSLGRSAGDMLLKMVAEWLTRRMGDSDLLARVDADHFAILLPVLETDGKLVELVENLLADFLEHPFKLDEAAYRIGIKIGIALFPDDGDDAVTLFRYAEAALNKAKVGGNRYLFYTQNMTKSAVAKLSLENQLRQALDNEEFVLYYQPKVDLTSGKITGVEALIRWNSPKTGLVLPDCFIPLLEETGLIHKVGRWVLRKAIEDHLRWRAAGLSAVRIAVNVSPLQLRNINFIDEIKEAIALDPHAAAGLELEITESVIMHDVENNIINLSAIRALGVTIAIDDFGTGFSSLSYLATLPVDTLKIDRAFVIAMTAGSQGLSLVSTIINLAHSLKLKVVAEGVETEEQSRTLRLLNCDEMQGFLFSKPVPVETFETNYLTPPSLRTSNNG